MSERIIEGTQFNAAESIKYSAPKATPQGAKSVNILNKATNTIITLSTPLMLTWGASDYKADGEEKGNGKFELSLQFPTDEYKNPETEAFLANIKGLESKIKSDALVYSKEWLGKVIKSAEVVDALMTPILKYPKDKATGDYDFTKAPTLRVKLPQWEGVWKSELYDEDGARLYPSQENPNLTPLDFLKKGTNIMCLIQFGGIWFINGKFSANWKLVQAVVQKPRATLQGQCFLKVKPQDKEALKKQVVQDEDIESTIVDDSDEEQGNDEDIPTPTPLTRQDSVSEPPMMPPPLARQMTTTADASGAVAPSTKKIIKKKVSSE